MPKRHSVAGRSKRVQATAVRLSSQANRVGFVWGTAATPRLGRGSLAPRNRKNHAVARLIGPLRVLHLILLVLEIGAVIHLPTVIEVHRGHLQLEEVLRGKRQVRSRLSLQRERQLRGV